MLKNIRLKTSSMMLLSLFISLTNISCAGESYEDCILNNVKGVTDKQALSMIRNACAEKTAAPIPKKCRDLPLQQSDFWARSGGTLRLSVPTGPPYQEECIAECKKSGWWEKTFGSCSTYF